MYMLRANYFLFKGIIKYTPYKSARRLNNQLLMANTTAKNILKSFDTKCDGAMNGEHMHANKKIIATNGHGANNFESKLQLLLQLDLKYSDS